MKELKFSQIFKNYKQIAPKHFWILKKDDGWYIKGLEDSRFSDVFVNGENVTNREVKITGGVTIQIADTIFELKGVL